MAHAINSGSAERPCLAICSGSGAFAGVGVTSTSPPPTSTHLHTHTHTHRHRTPPPSPSPPPSPGRHPGQARVHFHKTIASQPAPVSGGVGLRGEWNAGWPTPPNNGLSDEKALGELDIHYKRATPRAGPGTSLADLRLNLSLAFVRLFAVCPHPQPHPLPLNPTTRTAATHTHTHIHTYTRACGRLVLDRGGCSDVAFNVQEAKRCYFSKLKISIN